MTECKRVFADRVLVYSNSCGAADFDPNFQLAEAFERLNGIPVLRHASKKPDGASAVLEAFAGIEPGRIAFIGDRLFTDVLMANEAGMFSVLVSEPLSIQGDNLLAVVMRYFERSLLRRIIHQEKAVNNE